MHSMIFFPLGNADTCMVSLECGKALLFDYADVRNADDNDDLRIDLSSALREMLKSSEKSSFDVVAFTHADDDHIHGSSEFFFLEHAQKYQDEDRIKIDELWVPAAMVIEENLVGEARILRAEARYRLKNGAGIRVFSRPERLAEWLRSQGIDPKDRAHLVTDAGQIVPGFELGRDGIELFVHSPFAVDAADGQAIDRNESSIILHATFANNGLETRAIICGDTTYDDLSEIVRITKRHNRQNRLQWDIFDIPHHCSYLALSDERGSETTTPVPDVRWLLEQASSGGILASCSKPIPSDDEDAQPPHRQAASCYRHVASCIDGDFVVTMEHPRKSSPQPVVITIDAFGATLKKEDIRGSSSVTSRPAPRAGETRGRSVLSTDS